MYISEISTDLYLLENYPNKFISLYENITLSEGSIGDIRRIISDVLKDIGSNLSSSGIQTKEVIREINKNISISKNIILGYLKDGNTFEASMEFNVLIYKIWTRLKEYYGSRGIIEKSILVILFMFILIMTMLLFMFTLMNYAIIFVLLVVVIPVIVILIKLTLNFIRFRHKSNIGFPEEELNKSIIKVTEKFGVKNNVITSFLSNTTKKLTDKLEKDFESAIERSPKGGFTSRAIVMVIKSIKDQKNSGYF